MKPAAAHCAALLLGGLIAGSVVAGNVSVTVLDESGKPLRDAVVFLESAQAKRLAKPLPTAQMAQRDKTFIPSLLVVPTGTSVSFPNIDTVRHHVYSFSPAKRFELKLYVGTPTNPVLFDKAGVVVMGCNIHDQMLACILVVDTPFYGIAPANGVVNINELPSGDYSLQVWHSRLPVGAPSQKQIFKIASTHESVKVTLKGLGPQ
jgi:plastocyanin